MTTSQETAIFISYVKEDIESARKIYNDLKQAGLKPWLDEKVLLGGQKTEKAIREAIRGSRFFAVLLSEHSVKPGRVNKQVIRALEIFDEFPESDIFIIPVRLDDCTPSHEKLHKLHFVDMFPAWKDGLDKIIQTIQACSENGFPSGEQRAYPQVGGVTEHPPCPRSHAPRGNAGCSAPRGYPQGETCLTNLRHPTYGEQPDTPLNISDNRSEHFAGNHKKSDNPFGDMGRIKDPNRFFDRDELLRKIFEELDKGSNISLVGESQIGKSSLLSMICVLGQDRMKHPPENIVYISMEWVDDEDDFYETLCDELHVTACRGGKLMRVLKGKRYIVCIDEIEKMKGKGFTEKVRSHLRGLADGSAAPLRLVIASRSPLDHLFPDSPDLTSPLASICLKLDVGPFAQGVAREFLIQRLYGTGIVFTRQEINSLITKTGGHPAKLQRAAAELFDFYREK
ncbi:MAG: toll/interleukin-1 receptor domain-containing protein [Desulfobacteraceae bacterium]|nr:toll/interleukin-1 receptor domain-containing protein [Desulfobacteraceae bacterium]